MTDFTYRPDFGHKIADDHIEELQKKDPDYYVEIPEYEGMKVHKFYADWIAKYKRGKKFCCEKFKEEFDEHGLITNSSGHAKELFGTTYVFENFDGCDIKRTPFSFCPFCGSNLK